MQKHKNGKKKDGENMIFISDQLFTVFVVSNYIQFFLLNFVQYYFSKIKKI